MPDTADWFSENRKKKGIRKKEGNKKQDNDDVL
jgi:hypothetical protein